MALDQDRGAPTCFCEGQEGSRGRGHTIVRSPATGEWREGVRDGGRVALEQDLLDILLLVRSLGNIK